MGTEAIPSPRQPTSSAVESALSVYDQPHNSQMQLVSKSTQAGEDVKIKASDSLSGSVLDQPQDCQEKDLSTQSLSADSGMVVNLIYSHAAMYVVQFHCTKFSLSGSTIPWTGPGYWTGLWTGLWKCVFGAIALPKRPGVQCHAPWKPKH